MTARPTRRQLLRAGLAAGAGAALARYAPWEKVLLSAAAQAAERRALGFPVAAAEWHGDSSVGAAIRSGVNLGPPGECDVPLPFEPPVGPVDWTSSASRQKARSASFDRVLESMKTTIDVQVGPASFNDARGFFLTYVNTFNEWHEGTSFEPARNLADLLPEERRFSYHNPPDGARRLQLLQSLLRPVIFGGFP